MRRLFIAAFCLAFTMAGFAQEPEPAPQPEATQPALEFNSITHLLMERAPQLQAGFLSDGDRWLLYSPQFDVLSAASQQLLLRKYGYLSYEAGAAGDKRTRSFIRGESAAAAPSRAAIPALGANIRVTSPETAVGRRLHSETTIAVSGQNVVVGYNSEDDGVSYSNDGGATWRRSSLRFFPAFFATFGDPVVAAGPNGRFYHAYMAPSVFGFTSMAVSRSDDGGATWSAPVNASASVMTNQSSHDKPWFTVDNTAGSPNRGNLYLSWTLFQQNESSIRFVRSTDGGQTWSPAGALARLSLAETQAREVIQGSFIATGPNGEVYVIWYDSRAGGVRIRKSTDGGASFGDPVTALSPVGFQFSRYVNGHFDVPAFFQVVVDNGSSPNRGSVYVVANPLGADGTMDVTLTRSGDGGATWSAPVRVNNDATATDQFMPAVAVADNGNVGVAFLDRRNDPEDNSLLDVYLGVSTDGGRSFPVNQRVTTVNSPVLPTPLGFRAGYHADYNQVVASGNNFYIVWGDDRSGQDPDVYVAVMPVTGTLPDFALAAIRGSADVVPGGSAQFTFSTGGASGVALSAVSASPGLTFLASGNTVTASTSTATAPGTYSIQVSGTSGGMERGTVVRLTVHSPALRQAPVAVTEARDPAYLAHSSADSAGNIHLITARENASRVRRRLSYFRIPAGGGTPEPARSSALSDLAYREQTVLDPRVAADSSGRVFVVWRRTDRNGSHILLSSSTGGGAFSGPLDASTVALPSAAFAPALAVGRNGTVFVAFVQQLVRELFPGAFALVGQDLVLTRSTDGGVNFSPLVNVSRFLSGPNTVLTTNIALALDAADNPHLAWVGVTSAQTRTQDIYYSRSADGGRAFGPVVQVSLGNNSGVNPREPSLAVDSRGAVFVAWTNPDVRIGQQDVLLARSVDGSRFEAPVNLSSAAYWMGHLTDLPVLGVDPSGNVTAAWRQMVGNPLKNFDPQRDVFYARSTDGGLRWSTPVNISTNVGDTLQPPTLTVDRDGRVYVFWDDDTSGSPRIMMSVLP